MNTERISFEKATPKYQDIIFKWLSEPHIQEHWDNSQEHKEDIILFINGRKKASNYFNGSFSYWVGLLDEVPYCFILTAEVFSNTTLPKLLQENLSNSGKTYSLDFGIGDTNFLGKGLAANTLETFTAFFKKNVDTSADTFFIDPDVNNPRATHVYEKAGFKLVGCFIMDQGVFAGKQTYLMVKKLNLSF